MLYRMNVDRIGEYVYIHTSNGGVDQYGRHMLSHELASDTEIDACIDALRLEIEEVRRKAKRELRKVKENHLTALGFSSI